MINHILTNCTTSISDHKKNPMQVMESGEAVAVLNHNKPVFYCVPPELYAAMIDALEDIQLTEIVKARKDEKYFDVNIDQD